MLHPLDGSVIAVVRMLLLSPMREPFFLVVFPEADRSCRRLLGYWGSLEEAHEAALALFEQRTGHSISGGGQAPSGRVPPQKPPSAPYPTGQPVRPMEHGSR